MKALALGSKDKNTQRFNLKIRKKGKFIQSMALKKTGILFQGSISFIWTGSKFTKLASFTKLPIKKGLFPFFN
jgi:hypothetical protein